MTPKEVFSVSSLDFATSWVDHAAPAAQGSESGRTEFRAPGDRGPGAASQIGYLLSGTWACWAGAPFTFDSRKRDNFEIRQQMRWEGGRNHIHMAPAIDEHFLMIVDGCLPRSIRRRWQEE